VIKKPSVRPSELRCCWLGSRKGIQSPVWDKVQRAYGPANPQWFYLYGTGSPV